MLNEVSHTCVHAHTLVYVCISLRWLRCQVCSSLPLQTLRDGLTSTEDRLRKQQVQSDYLVRVGVWCEWCLWRCGGVVLVLVSVVCGVGWGVCVWCLWGVWRGYGWVGVVLVSVVCVVCVGGWEEVLVVSVGCVGWVWVWVVMYAIVLMFHGHSCLY